MLTHKAQWMHRRQSSFYSVTITWRRECHHVGQGYSIGPIVWDRVNVCVSPSTVRACSILRMVSIVPVWLEGLRLTNGKRLLSPSPNLRFAVQIYHYGYDVDLWHPGLLLACTSETKAIILHYESMDTEIKQPERLD